MIAGHIKGALLCRFTPSDITTSYVLPKYGFIEPLPQNRKWKAIQSLCFMQVE